MFSGAGFKPISGLRFVRSVHTIAAWKQITIRYGSRRNAAVAPMIASIPRK